MKKEIKLKEIKESSYAFGRALLRIRTAQRLSQDALAANASLHRTAIHLLETGERNPSLHTMLALCRGLEIDLVFLAAEIQKELPEDYGQ